MKIAIAGYGVEGKENYIYWNTLGHEVVIVDERDIPANELPLDANVITGEGAFKTLRGYDLVVRTASLPPRNIITDGVVWSATNEFFARAAEKNIPIIGVTGTKGKGTTSSLIAALLRAAGKTVYLVGNIGVPALSVLPMLSEDDIVVYEMSSFQLWDLQVSPQVAVVLMIEPDHLDVHVDFEDYILAKSQIAANQTTVDRMVYFSANEWSVQIAKTSPGQLLPYPSERGAHIRADSLWYGDNELCSLDNLQLPGKHNEDNACAAITAAWPWVQDGSVIAEGLRSFDGLPHRLKHIRTIHNVRYYDDSIATTPGSAIAAIHAFNEPKILILGGSHKGADFSELASVIARSNVKAIILLGDEALHIQVALETAGVHAITNLGSSTTMEKIVEIAHATAQPHDVVILSPACASFGMFKNYADRGEQFIAAVESLPE